MVLSTEVDYVGIPEPNVRVDHIGGTRHVVDLEPHLSWIRNVLWQQMADH